MSLKGKTYDYIIRGEGEKTFADMLDTIEGKQKWEDISGLSYRRNGGFVHNPPRPLENLETLQLPRRTARMWDGYLFSGKKLDMVETSRGCTMTCNFYGGNTNGSTQPFSRQRLCLRQILRWLISSVYLS